MIRILVVDDHKIFRQGVVGLLDSEGPFEVIAEAGTGMDALRLAQDLQPDVVLMDIALPDFDGIEAARRMSEAGVDTRIILLTMFIEPDFTNKSSVANIKGYLIKEDAFDDLVYAIKAVARGERFVSSSLDKPQTINTVNAFLGPPLTSREKEIVALIAEGFTSKEVAEKLYISHKTVENHRSNIMEKLELKGLADLVRYAIRVGIIKP
jgi:two-component system, NarL family, response regulator NreC